MAQPVLPVCTPQGRSCRMAVRRDAAHLILVERAPARTALRDTLPPERDRPRGRVLEDALLDELDDTLDGTELVELAVPDDRDWPGINGRGVRIMCGMKYGLPPDLDALDVVLDVDTLVVDADTDEVTEDVIEAEIEAEESDWDAMEAETEDSTEEMEDSTEEITDDTLDTTDDGSTEEEGP